MTRELRSTDEKPALKDENKIAGYAAVYGSRSVDLGGFVEVLKPGCFDRCLSEAQDVRGLFNHDANCVLGRTAAGTCRIKSDEHGLAYEIDLADRQLDRDLRVSMKRGDVTGSSFAFLVAPDGDSWNMDSSGLIVREVNRVQTLYDVSPVTYPAYLATESSIRAQQLRSAGEADAAAMAKAKQMRQWEGQRMRMRQRQAEAEAKS
jgi:HK97 family phage prohead protease